MTNVNLNPKFDYELICHPEDASIEGNASALDPDTDARIVKEIRDQLAAGNQWAWCTVELKCTYKGMETSDFLGCCSYLSEYDFMASDYYEDMINTVTEDMQSLIKDIKQGG